MNEFLSLLLVGGGVVAITLLGYWLWIELPHWWRNRRARRSWPRD